MNVIQKAIEFFFRKKWLGLLLLTGLAVGIGISTIYRGAVSPKQRTDLTVFLKAGEMVAIGRANHIYGIENARHWHYVYPPILAILLAPVSKWPLGVTVTLAYLLSLASLAGTIFFSRRFVENVGSGFISPSKSDSSMSFPHALSGNPGPGLYSGSPIKTFGDDNLKRNAAKGLTDTYGTVSKTAPWQIALAMFFCLPAFLNTLTRGQFGVLVIFFAAAIFYFYRREQKVLAGLLFAFAVSVKISPLAFLAFFFLMKREWRILVSATFGVFLFFFLIPSLAIGFDTNWELLKNWKYLMSIARSDQAYQNYLWPELFTPFASDNQSIYAVLTRLSWPSEAQFLGRSNAWVRNLTSGLAVLLLALPGLKMLRKHYPEQEKEALASFAEFSLFPMLMLFTSPVTQIHHYTVLFPLFLAALLLIDRCKPGNRKRLYLVSGIWVCAISLTVGMIFEKAALWGLPLWGSMFFWLVVLFTLPPRASRAA